MTFKKTALELATIAISLTLGACSSTSTDDVTLNNIQKNDKLVVALNPEFAPFEFKTLVDGKDTILGSDVALAQAIADELDVELELSPMSFDNVLSSLQSGKADIAISGISVTEERKKTFDFSNAYYQAKNVLIVKEENSAKFSTIKSLSGKNIAAQKGSVQENVIKEQIPEANLISLTSNGNMITELKSGTVDAVILEKPIAQGYILNNPGLVLSTIELDSSATDSYAVALPKNNRTLKEKINRVVKDLVDSGKYEDYVQEAYQANTNE
ncbi:transporter substrate-binding domain-containing protein [Streptococcus sp. 20-1249]|uniref:transporter substrate-binding domain-containing protein n=1 Tax=Streptococcus hepaticus TaxID=3349163 RepID=UPI003748317A